MSLKQRAELIGGHADIGKDATQGALEQILTAVDRNGHGTPVRMAHDVVATVDPRDSKAGTLQRLDYLRSRYGRDSAGHKPARYYKSGHVECQCEFVRYPNFLDQKLKAGTQISYRIFLRLTLTERGNAGTELGGCIPTGAALILFDDVRHVNDSSHSVEYALHSAAWHCLGLHPKANTHDHARHTGTSWDVFCYSRRRDHPSDERS
jgi:hypothetical protein